MQSQIALSMQRMIVDLQNSPNSKFVDYALHFSCCTEFSVYTPDNRDYIILSELSQSISERIISFKVQSCTNAYVGLISGTDDTDPLYEIAIGTYQNTRSYIRIGKDYSATKFSENAGPVIDCYAYTEFCITWDDNTINVRLGLDVTGSLFLSWTSGTDLLPIFNVGICTANYGSTGNWIFYAQDLQTTTDEVTTLHKGIPSTDLLILTGETSQSQPTGTDGISTRLQTIKPMLTIIDDTTEQSQSTSPVMSLSTTGAESYNNTCSCVCPKAFGTPTSNVPVARLKIDIKSLSSYKRKLQCATDPRKSSYYIGCVGITILSLYFAFIVLLDCLPKV
ncbi:unnamed protein product [Mytilus coruscus]|uniref:Farnesoic acid O-methyl transferase domain-containing protein n=1 Tax=Mytilus coruscus TaxID=42192 RepID=A0A6J8A2I6_MYTCO|nr:unnamed protein product [Mytilus coruscus]